MRLKIKRKCMRMQRKSCIVSVKTGHNDAKQKNGKYRYNISTSQFTRIEFFIFLESYDSVQQIEMDFCFTNSSRALGLILSSGYSVCRDVFLVFVVPSGSLFSSLYLNSPKVIALRPQFGFKKKNSTKNSF